MVWLKENRKILDPGNKLALGFVYSPPLGSHYYDDESFKNLEKEITYLKEQGCDIILVGDFNARTKTVNDFIEYDDSFLEHVGVEYSYIKNMYNIWKIHC